MNREKGEIGFFKTALYSLPAIPLLALSLPLYVHLPPFYVTEIGLSAATVGVVFMMARFWDVFTDPTMGAIFDRINTRWGRRRIWMVIAVPLLMVCVYMLFMPARDVGAGYLLFWLFLFFIGWTMIYLSHLAWGAELSENYHRRSVIQGVREALGILGMISVLIMPVIIDFSGVEDAGFRRISAMGMFILIAMPLAVLIAVISVGEDPARHTGDSPRAESWHAAIAFLYRNAALRRLIAADLVLGVTLGTVAGLFIFLARDVLLLGPWANILVLVYFMSGVAFMPLMLKIAAIFGKHRTVSLSCLFNACTVLLILIVPPGSYILAALIWAFLGSNIVLAPTLLRSITADVAEQDAVHTGGRERTGLFFSFLTLTNKVGSALAIGITYTILQFAIGYEQGVEYQAGDLEGLRWLYVSISSSTHAIAAVLMWNFPLSERQQLENRRILQGRKFAPAVPPAS